MGFPVKVVIFETGEMFDSRQDLANELRIPLETLKNYLYTNRLWNGLHFYSVSKISGRCNTCNAILTDENYHGYIKKYQHGCCWDCTHKIRKEYNQRTRETRRTRMLKRDYGITDSDYGKILIDQNGVCAICGNSEVAANNQRNGVLKLSVDHNHVTNQIRGLLCQRCNTGLGKFLIDECGIDLLNKAIKYVEKN